MATGASSFACLTQTIPQWLRSLDHVRNSIAMQYMETPLPRCDQVEDVHRESAVSAKLPVSPGHAFPTQHQRKHHERTMPSPTVSNSKDHESQLRQFPLPPKPLGRPGNAFLAKKQCNTPATTLANINHHKPQLQQHAGNTTQAKHQQSLLLPPPANPKHHESPPQNPPPTSPHPSTSRQSSKRKRSIPTIPSPDHSAPATTRRKKIEVYYNGEAQTAFKNLSKDIIRARSTLQSSKSGEHFRAASEREDKERREREQAEAAKHPGLYRSITEQPRFQNWHQQPLDPAMETAFMDVGRALEKALLAIDEAAWENLRNGECEAEIMKVRDCLLEALGAAHTEVLRWEEKRRERERAIKEGTLLPRMPLVNLVQWTEVRQGVTYNAATAIEVDEEEEEEDDDGKEIGITEMIRLGVRATARVAAR